MTGEKAKVESGNGLLRYMAVADETLQELLGSDSAFMRVLFRYDTYFRRDLWEHSPPTPSFAFVLFLNAYQMFLAGTRVAMSGHAAAIYPLMRTALESASYGLLLLEQPALSGVWKNRSRSEADKKACRNAFTFEKAIAGLKSKAPDIHRMAKEAYEGAIDFGAHPNPKGVIGHLSIDNERPDGFTALTHTSLYDANHHHTLRGLCACLDFGFLIISIIALAGPSPSDTLADELSGLHDAKEAAIAEECE